eukprot:2029538-Rhodomonas_salina.2
MGLGQTARAACTDTYTHDQRANPKHDNTNPQHTAYSQPRKIGGFVAERVVPRGPGHAANCEADELVVLLAALGR